VRMRTVSSSADTINSTGEQEADQQYSVVAPAVYHMDSEAIVEGDILDNSLRLHYLQELAMGNAVRVREIDNGRCSGPLFLFIPHNCAEQSGFKIIYFG